MVSNIDVERHTYKAFITKYVSPSLEPSAANCERVPPHANRNKAGRVNSDDKIRKPSTYKKDTL